MTFDELLRRPKKYLYAGDLVLEHKDDYAEMVGLSLTQSDRYHILHDITRPFPIPDGCIDFFQAEDVFEHIEYGKIPSILQEIYRILAPGGYLRFSVPDYRCDVLSNRSVKDKDGEIIFDPGGGGFFDDEKRKVVAGGHVWFPVIETVRNLIAAAPFGKCFFYHYTDTDGTYVMHEIDYTKGFIRRTPDHDMRVCNPKRPMSIIVDCIK